MITAGNISDYLYVRSRDLGIKEIYQWGNIPSGKVKKPRVTIQVKTSKDGKIWNEGYVEINLCFPYLDPNGTAPLDELDTYELEGRKLFDGIVDKVIDEWLSLEIESVTRYKDEILQAYYLNLHTRFRVLNINQ